MKYDGVVFPYYRPIKAPIFSLRANWGLVSSSKTIHYVDRRSWGYSHRSPESRLISLIRSTLSAQIGENVTNWAHNHQSKWKEWLRGNSRNIAEQDVELNKECWKSESMRLMPRCMLGESEYMHHTLLIIIIRLTPITRFNYGPSLSGCSNPNKNEPSGKTLKINSLNSKRKISNLDSWN